jgi:hypothetical protein
VLEPNGPLPPEIYWRRRAFAIGVLVVALALVIWVVLAVARGGDSPGDTKSAGSSSVVAKPADAAAKPSGDSGAAKSSAASTSVAAAGPCPDQSLAIKVTVEQPTYKTGEQPVFGIVITNISSVACTRDMGSGLQQVSVHTLDGQRRLWSSTDCYPTSAR